MDYNKKYIGSTRRCVLTRFKVHTANFGLSRIEMSSVAQQVFETDRNIHHINVKLIRPISNYKLVNVFESLKIYKSESRSMNCDKNPHYFC